LADLGAEVVVGDFLDFDAVSAAMVGVKGAYFCYPVLPGGLLEATAIFAQAATGAGVASVVNMSQISARRDAGSHAALHHWIAERMLDRCSFRTTHLRPTLFAEWLKWGWTRRADEGVVRLPFVGGTHAPISGRDQAAVVAAILQNPAPHDRQIYPLFGAEERDHTAIAEEIGAAIGLPARFEPVDISTFTAALSSAGLPGFFVQHISNIAIDYQRGVFAGENNVVEVISGRKPMTIADFVTANRAEFDRDGIFALPS
jgi:NAD(P)H dehydrogenase (quinone)